MLTATIIIPVYNGARFLERCLSSLRAQQGATCDVVVVDNASSDGSAELVATHFPEVTLLGNARNEGFSRGVNRGIQSAVGRSQSAVNQKAEGRRQKADEDARGQSALNTQHSTLKTDQHIASSPRRLVASSPLTSRTPHPASRIPDVCVLLNQDTEVAPDWLRELLAAFERDEQIGAVGCKIYDDDGRTLQHAGGRLDYPRATSQHIGLGEVDTGQYDTPGEMPYVTGAAMGLRTAALREVGLLDERFSPAYMEEVDLCWRLRTAGWKVWYNPAARVSHVEHGSPLTIIPRLTLLHRNRLRFVFKHYRAEQILNDFWPAERRALAGLVGTFDESALLRAYLDALLQLDAFDTARADIGMPSLTPTERRTALEMLRELRDDLRTLRDCRTQNS